MKGRSGYIKVDLRAGGAGRGRRLPCRGRRPPGGV